MMRWRGALQRRRSERIAAAVLKKNAVSFIPRHPAWDDPEWMQARQRAYNILRDYFNAQRVTDDAHKTHRYVMRVLQRIERNLGYPV